MLTESTLNVTKISGTSATCIQSPFANLNPFMPNGLFHFIVSGEINVYLVKIKVVLITSELSFQ